MFIKIRLAQNSIQTNLTVDENVMVFVEYNYSMGGTFTVVANASNNTDFDSEQINVTIG